MPIVKLTNHSVAGLKGRNGQPSVTYHEVSETEANVILRQAVANWVTHTAEIVEKRGDRP